MMSTKIYLTKKKSNMIIYKEGDPIKKIFIIKSGVVRQYKKVIKSDLSPQLLNKYPQIFNKISFPLNLPIKNFSDGTFLGFDNLIR